MRRFKYLICFILPCFQSSFCFSQQTDTALYNINWQVDNFPITRDTLNQFPDSLMVEALLSDYTMGIPCGLFCGCGTLKLKLTNTSSIYKYNDVYVAIGCFYELTKDIEEKTRWMLYKILLNDNACFWTSFTINKFNTKGLPFYTLEKPQKPTKKPLTDAYRNSGLPRNWQH